MNVSVIIPAAGRGTRFGASDKLNQDLGGRPLLVRTVELFSKREEVGQVIVAGPPGPEDYETFRERFAATLSFLGAMVVEGGAAERWETVRNAIKAVADDATHIAVHDAARPATGNDVLNRVFEAAKSLPAVIPGVRVSATIKRIAAEAESVTPAEDDAIADAIFGDAGRVNIEAMRVTETVPRDGLMEIQTPQVFEADLLRRAYAQPDLRGATDDASLVERLGETVHVVEGDACNIKVTTPGDLRLVRAILGVKAPEARPVHKQF